MNDPVQREVEDIARKTRVVPITMMLAVVFALALLTTFVIGVDQDSDDGSLYDAEGVVNDDTIETLNEISPID
ncbi:MAG: hypothetical protein RIC56_09790 [Pseudomonadales bacterium]